jgi:DNA polymerase IV
MLLRNQGLQMPDTDEIDIFLPYEGSVIFLVDLDAFFAAVEQLDHPAWRGKPVIVGGDAKRRGVVSTCSYEARAYGIHSAMPSWQAEKLCPTAIWTAGHMDRYREISRLVMGILNDESPHLEQVSIDEAFLDVTGGSYVKEHPLAIAQRISRRISAIGITCSIGIGTTKSIAKIASDIEKPRGITIVYPGTEQSFLAPLPVRRLSGVGRKAEERLTRAGISTLGEMGQASRGALEPIFGINWEMMKRRANGTEISPVVPNETVKSVSNEQTFAHDLVERQEIETAIDLMATKVGRRLRTKHLAGHLLTLKVKYANATIHTAQAQSTPSLDDEYIMMPLLHELLDQVWSPGIALRLVGVGVSHFTPRDEQLALFTEDLSNNNSNESDHANGPRGKNLKRKKKLDAQESALLVQATDKVKDRFGEDALHYGRELKLKDANTGNIAQNIE